MAGQWAAARLFLPKSMRRHRRNHAEKVDQKLMSHATVSDDSGAELEFRPSGITGYDSASQSTRARHRNKDEDA